jgi:hypothetical protein
VLVVLVSADMCELFLLAHRGPSALARTPGSGSRKADV